MIFPGKVIFYKVAPHEISHLYGPALTILSMKKKWLISWIGKTDHDCANGLRGEDLGPVASAVKSLPRSFWPHAALLSAILKKSIRSEPVRCSPFLRGFHRASPRGKSRSRRLFAIKATQPRSTASGTWGIARDATRLTAASTSGTASRVPRTRACSPARPASMLQWCRCRT